MDGTLIEQRIDFAAIGAALDIDEQTGLIEAIAAMAGPDRAQAEAHLLACELAAAETAELVPGADDVLRRIREAGLKTALLTRNAPQAMAVVLERFGLHFDLAWARDQGPIKPEPDGVLRACASLGVRPKDTLCVGDFRYDVVAANAAGAVSVWLAHGRRDETAAEADVVIDRLSDLLAVLEL